MCLISYVVIPKREAFFKKKRVYLLRSFRSHHGPLNLAPRWLETDLIDQARRSSSICSGVCCESQASAAVLVRMASQWRPR